METPRAAPALRGLRVSVVDSAAAAAWLQGLFAAPLAQDGNGRWPRLGFAGCWIEVRTGLGDALAMQCADLAQQRTYLQRLGIEPVDGAAAGGTPRLRLDTMDTGACAIELSEVPAKVEPLDTKLWHESSVANAPVCDTRAQTALCGLELAVRSPERIALHWAQLFHSSVVRATGGLPALRLPGFDLRFGLADDGRARVSAIDFAVPDVVELAHRASAHGTSAQAGREGHVMLEAHGIRLSLRPVN